MFSDEYIDIWNIGTGKDFATSEGYIHSAVHGGLMPDAATGWETLGGGKFHVDAGVSVTSDGGGGAAAGGMCLGRKKEAGGRAARACADAAALAPPREMPLTRNCVAHTNSAQRSWPAQARALYAGDATARVVDAAADERRLLPPRS
eukprot:gene19303-biopygen17225